MELHKPFSGIIFFCLLIFLVTGTAEAFPRPRLLVKSVSASQLKLQIRSKRKRKIAYAVIEVARESSRFAPFLILLRSEVSKSRKIQISDTGHFRFRARVFSTGKGFSGWSKVQRVVLSDGEPQHASSPSPGSSDWPALTDGLRECAPGVEEQHLALVNETRINIGLNKLSEAYELELAARKHSIWMAKENLLSHQGWFERIAASGFRGSHLAQNVAFGMRDPQTLLDAFLASEGHAENVLDDQSKFLGISCVQSADGKYYWTQNFGG